MITRLTAEWQVDYDAWQKRGLSVPATMIALFCLCLARHRLRHDK